MTLRELEQALTALYVEAREMATRGEYVRLRDYTVIMEAQEDEVRGVYVDHATHTVYLDNKAH